MAANSHFFSGPKSAGVYLAARGFDARSGHRSGGIVDPQRVLLPAGARLVRFFHDPGAQFGGWWSTTYELLHVVDHFGRGGSAFDEGRAEGRGLLHAVLAVRHDWAGGTPEHLGRFTIVGVRHGLEAFHGEGDHAPDSSQTRNQKAARIVVQGQQRGARQLYLPECKSYLGEFDVRTSGWTATDLLSALRSHDIGALSFER